MSDARPKPPFWLTLFTAAASLVVTFAVWQALQQREDGLLHAEFRRDAENRILAVQRELASDVELLFAVAAFYAGSQDVDREEFAAFTRPLLDRHPGVRAMQWAPRVPGDLRAVFEREVVQRGAHAAYEVRQLDEQQRPVRAAPRDEHFPVLYVEPFERNLASIGFDHASDPRRWRQMQTARDTGQPRATGQIELISAPGQGPQRGVLVFMPVYENGQPVQTQAQRQQHLQGFVVGVIVLADTVAKALTHMQPVGIDLAVRDDSARDAPAWLYRYRSPLRTEQDDDTALPAHPPGDLHLPETLNVAGRVWTIHCLPTHAYIARRTPRYSGAALFAGLVISALLCGFVWATAGRTSRVEAKVRRRTQELSRVNASLETEIERRAELEQELLRKRLEYQIIFDTVPSMIWVKDTDSRFRLVNQSAANTAGLEMAEMIGKTDYELYPRFAEKYVADDRQVIETATPKLNIEEPHVLPTGEQRWLRTDKVPLRDEHDNVIGLVVVATDITDRKQAEIALKQSEERFELAVQGTSDGLWDWDIPTDRVWYAPRFRELLGYGPDDPFPHVFSTFEQHLHPDDREPTYDAVNRHLDHDTPYDVEYRMRTRSGEYRWFRARGAAVRDASGTAVRMAGSIQDITEQKRFEQRLAQQAEALEKANAELKRSNEELDSFAYIASHDLKEPLRGLHNYASFLKEDYAEKLDAEGQEWLDALMRLTRRMEDLINSLLYYSRVGRTELAVEEVDLNETLENVLERLAATLAERGVQVRVPRPLPQAWCDRVRVREVFANLIANASKYNDKDDKWVEVGYIEPPRESDEPAADPNAADTTVFYIRDNGIGIPDERREQVFEMFRRLHGRDRFGGGTGAGLTIVKKIVHRHGGKIWIESEEGEGTTFYFTLA